MMKPFFAVLMLALLPLLLATTIPANIEPYKSPCGDKANVSSICRLKKMRMSSYRNCEVVVCDNDGKPGFLCQCITEE